MPHWMRVYSSPTQMTFRFPSLSLLILGLSCWFLVTAVTRSSLRMWASK